MEQANRKLEDEMKATAVTKLDVETVDINKPYIEMVSY